MDKLLSRRRALVVEDEMLIVIMIEDMLVDLGCESVSTAATVRQALALIESQVFDFAMLDMNLNGSNSYAVAEALAARNVPFIFSTGYSGNAIVDGFGDRIVLRKPFVERDLTHALKRLLAL